MQNDMRKKENIILQNLKNFKICAGDHKKKEESPQMRWANDQKKQTEPSRNK